ncbi:MAG: decarboxylating 6-phosphogluconate dehydrogenase [Planctomycetes bacterium]|nr:decarboxylating 6-phosphogluconate dehydrogenase [Planctomycetota bacterium]
MRIGILGLGKMGGNMAARLLRGGHEVVGHNRTPEALALLAASGGIAARSVEALVGGLEPPRVIWIMIPAGRPVDEAIEALRPRLSPGDVIVDGGNSNYRDTMRRAALLRGGGLHLVDVGTSGGVWGLGEGYSLMVGGEEAVVEYLRPVLATLAPDPSRGWGRVGGPGAGHFVKMVHNGIEYGLMQAYAEGFAILHHKEEFALDLPRIAEIWQSGSVVRSWLLDLLAAALRANPAMDGIKPWVADSGEGRWTVTEAVDLGVPAPVISLALMARYRSRDEESFADRLLAALRNSFGGHAIRREV